MKAIAISVVAGLLTSIICPFRADANDLGNTSYTFKQSFGLSTGKRFGRHRVVTFIPATFLLFDISSAEIKIGTETYKSVTTQDGVKLLVLTSIISTGNFEVFGGNDVIFNKDYGDSFRAFSR